MGIVLNNGLWSPIPSPSNSFIKGPNKKYFVMGTALNIHKVLDPKFSYQNLTLKILFHYLDKLFVLP